MNNKIIFLMCLLLALVWTAGCACPGPKPLAAAPPVVEPEPYRPAPPPEVTPPTPVEEPAPSKKLKKRVIY
jgi:hypothetical protein